MLPSVSTASTRTLRPRLAAVPMIASTTRVYSPPAGPLAKVTSSCARARRRSIARSAWSSSSEMILSERGSMPGGPMLTCEASRSR